MREARAAPAPPGQLSRRASEAALAVAAALFMAPAHATQPACEGAVGDAIPSARIVAVDRVYFVANASAPRPSCPSPEPACRLKPFLVRGDEVLVAPSNGPYLCATFKSRQGVETRGWLPAAALSVAPPKAFSALDWVGAWRRGKDGFIDIESRGDKIVVRGQATWTSATTTNTGDLSGEGIPRDGVLAIGYDPAKSTSPPNADSGECAARLEIGASRLFVEDNGNCGGLNVSFNGVYDRARK